MAKNKDFFTIMVFSGMAGKCMRFKIAMRTLKIVSICIISLISIISISSVIFIKNYLTVSNEVRELSVLKKRTGDQKREIDSFVQKIKILETQMTKLEKFDKKLKKIISIEDSSGIGSKVGVGGPEENMLDSYNIKTNDPDLIVTDTLTDNIDRLFSEAHTQLVSFQRMDEFFKNQESLLTSTPSIWPTRGWITSGFGYRKSPFTGLREVHEGVDIATGMVSPILAPADGIVIRTGVENGYGKILEIDHGYGIVTRYGHNSKHFVNTGDKVKRGQHIASVGNTGLSTGPHLHYEILINGVPVNPLKYILEE